jgi:polysaccharide export outer membrane protein
MRKLVALSTLLMFSSALAAQVAGGSSATSESLLIGPGDLLHVQFYDTPELEQHPRVDDAGAAPLLFLGPVTLAGKTPMEAATTIAAQMVAGHFMSHPQVVVTIEQYATQEVTVSGEVARPGNYAITTPRSVLDVLSMAGGLSALADRHIVIQRRGMTNESVSYFVSNDPKVQLATDIKIRPGDVILIARAGVVYILGDVGRPGGYPLATNDGKESLLQAVAVAGAANKTAVLSGVRLLHKTSTGYSEEKIDLDKIQKGEAPDIVLAANDVIFVPFSYAKNFALNGTAVAASVVSAALYNF